MVNETRQRSVPNWQRQAWLTEYQACQHDNSSSGQSYWTLAGIFIGITSVLLGALIYGVFANKTLLWILLENREPGQILAVGITTIILGLGAIAILYFLKRWIKRITFLQQINFYRMREIERKLKMWKSWRVHGVDHWRSPDFEENIGDEDQAMLLNYKEAKWWQDWKTSDKYERPSVWCFKGIFYTLISLWGLIILGALIALVRAIFS